METPPVKEISFTDYSGFAPACQVFFLNSLRHFSQQLAKKGNSPKEFPFGDCQKTCDTAGG
jgi:hypothetical protein